MVQIFYQNFTDFASFKRAYNTRTFELVNDAACTALATAVATRLFGSGRVTPQGAPITASEDFAFMLQRVPGCYFFIGNGATGTPGGCMVHNPGYDFNDDLIADGAAFWCALVSEVLAPAQA